MSRTLPVRVGLAPSAAVAAFVLIAGSPADAQPTLPPQMPPSITVVQSAEFAALRARFESLTPSELAQDGYQIDPLCVTAAMAGAPPELGNMGYHAVHPTLMKVQFGNGRPDPEQRNKGSRRCPAPRRHTRASRHEQVPFQTIARQGTNDERMPSTGRDSSSDIAVTTPRLTRWWLRR